MKKILFALLLMLSFVFVKGQIPQAPIIFNTIQQMVGIRTSYTVAKVNDTSRGGIFNKVIKGALIPDDGVIFQSVDPNYVWIRDISQSNKIDIRWFGKTTGDDITATLKSIDGKYSNIYLPGVYTLDSINFSYPIQITGDGDSSGIRLLTPSNLNAPAITLNGANSAIKNLKIDLNNTSRTGIVINGAYANIDVTMTNASADANSTTNTVGINVAAAHATISLRAFNFVNTGQSNGSNPRMINIGLGADDYNLISVTGYNVRAGVVIGTLSGTGNIDYLALTNAHDNGVYHLGGGGLHFGTIIYNGIEEGVVTEGRLEGGTIIGDSSWNRLLGIEDAEYVNVGQIIMQQKDSTKSGNAITIRSGNDSSGTVYIGRISGTLRGNNLIAGSTGIVDNLNIGEVEVTYFYDTSSSGTLNQWCNLSAAHTLNIGRFRVRVIDQTSSLVNSDRFTLTLIDSMWGASTINDVLVNITKSDGTTKSLAQFRGVNFPQQNLYTNGIIWEVLDSSIYAREIDVQEDATPNSINMIPKSGWWRWGTVLRLRQERKRSFSIRCIGSGTPGNWIYDDMLNTRTLFSSDTLREGDQNINILPNLGNVTFVLMNPDSSFLYDSIGVNSGWTKEFYIKSIANANNTDSVIIKSPNNTNIVMDGINKDSLFLLCNGCSITLRSNGVNWYIYNSDPIFTRWNAKVTTRNVDDTLITTNIMPDVNNTRNLGTSSRVWNRVMANGVRTGGTTQPLIFQMGSTEVGRFAATTNSLLLGTNTDVASSRFTVNSTTQGVLIPRMTTVQRAAISSPVEGLEVYDLGYHAKMIYNGTVWTGYRYNGSKFQGFDGSSWVDLN